MKTKIKMAMVGGSTLILSMFALSAQAGNLVLNNSFETINSPTPLSNFIITPGNTTEVPDWLTTSGVSFLILPGQATIPTLDPSTPGRYLSLWPGCASGSILTNCISPTPFPSTSPDGGNFIAVDGAYLQGTLQQTVSVVNGQSYSVSFWQAAGQLNDPYNSCCTGLTTEQWLVSLGNQSQLAPVMNNDSQSFVDWQQKTLTFTATVTGSEVLGFFAIGGPYPVPPFVLLDGVSMTAVPEPATYALMGIGLLGILAVRRQQKKRA
jgi:PEP-CTERM motif/Protein of unknown function (DUF642)